MNTLHSKGEWVIEHCHGEGTFINSNGKLITIIQNETGENNAEDDANTKLIAASPKMIEFIGKVMSKLQEHQKEDKKIIAGYTLAANIDGFTYLLNEAGEIWRSALSWSE